LAWRARQKNDRSAPSLEIDVAMDFDDFRKQVKDALEHLYHTAHLETHPLLSHLADTSSTTRTTRAQKLRALLKDAIEQLRPQQELISHSPEWRSYLALRYRYVQGMSQGEIESELGISLRQLQRELHKGLDALATLLWEQRQTLAPVEMPSAAHELENELSQWTLTRQSCDVHALIDETISTLKPMIEARRVNIELRLPAELKVFVDATLTRQALLDVFRLAVNQARAQIGVSAKLAEKNVGLTIVVENFVVDAQAEAWHNAEFLFKAQGGILDLNPSGQIVIFLPRPTQPRVLIIDDNPAIQQLFERYLAPHQYLVFHAQNGDEALRLAAELKPDAITLDVMMPRMDGWQVLRALRANPATAKIPVIVCSVLKEPEIALALGARAYLKKPVERLTLVETLARILGASAEAPPPTPAPN
jgi:CheY-like chemotaxis protein/DNA-directed RNA polymerase specialized sigma24 family protein